MAHVTLSNKLSVSRSVSRRLIYVLLLLSLAHTEDIVGKEEINKHSK